MGEITINVLVVISTLVTAAATVGIFAFTRRTYSLYQSIQRRQEESERKFNDLLEAIVIATLLSGPSSTGAFDGAKRAFLQQYKGATQIFKGS